MKIVEAPVPWAKRIRCECTALLEVDNEDVRVGDFGVKWGVPEVELRCYVTCPLCSTTLFIEDDDMPGGLRKRLIEEWHEKDTENAGLLLNNGDWREQ